MQRMKGPKTMSIMGACTRPAFKYPLMLVGIFCLNPHLHSSANDRANTLLRHEPLTFYCRIVLASPTKRAIKV